MTHIKTGYSICFTQKLFKYFTNVIVFVKKYLI